MAEVEELPEEERPEVEPFEVEMCAPARLILHIAQAACASNINGEFAFNEHIRDAIGMQLLKYVKRVTKEY